MDDLKPLYDRVMALSACQAQQARILREIGAQLQSMSSKSADEPAWLAIARHELERGVHEIQGEEDNPRITEYLKVTSLPASYHQDETPWCSAFVAWCCREAGVERSVSAAARSWLTVGQECDRQVGAIAVLWRGSRRGWQGHVGFVVGGSVGQVELLGGNQKNSVSIASYHAERVIGYRWPVNP